MKILVSVVFILISSLSLASVSYSPLTYSKKNKPISDGVYLGGKLGKTLDLLNIRRRFYSGIKTDRWIFDLGEKDGVYRDSPPLVHIALNGQRRTLTIDIKKVKMNEEGGMVKALRESSFVSDVQVVSDEVNKELTMQVILNKSVKLEAFFLPNNKKNSRLVLDISSNN